MGRLACRSQSGRLTVDEGNLKNKGNLLKSAMKTHRTIRYRLHPGSRTKARKLQGTAEACRFTWNHFVGKLRDDYKWCGRCDPRWYSNGKLFAIWRKHQEKWLQDYSCAIVRLSLKPIETGYKKFYAGQGGLPRFKPQYDHVPSFPLGSGMFRLQGEYLHIQRIGQVKLRGHNPYSNAKSVSGTIKREARGWYAYIVYEVEITALPTTIKPVGIDRNVGQIARSDGVVHYTPDLEKLEARKRRYQRMMARRQRGSRKQGVKPSNRYLKAKNLAARTQQKIVQARTDWCHQVSREIANKYNVAYFEDLDTRGMTASAKGAKEHPGKHVKQKAGLNRGILSSGWYKLEHYLGYKASVTKVNPAYTSQACHACGHIDKKNRKTRAYHECVACGYRDHADCNAALNILAFGNEATGRGGGGVTRPGKRQMDTSGPLRLSI